MRALPFLLLCSILVSACDQGSKAEPKNNSSATLASQPQGERSDPFVADDDQPAGHALMLSSSFTGASTNGKEADLRLRYKVSPHIQPAVTSATQVVVAINESGRSVELYRKKLDTATMDGELDVTIEPSSDSASLVVGLDHLAADVVTDTPAYSTITLPAAVTLEDSDLSSIKDLVVQLVPGSYDTALVGDRREHRFAVRVLAKYDNQAAQSSVCDAVGDVDIVNQESIADMVDLEEYKPVIGLDKTAATNFIALEYGYADVESPVTVSFSKESLGVYFVMDVSSSVVESGVADHMLDAVARSVVSLAQFSDFNYRIFASNVFEIGSLRDINFDDSAGSGTALYYGIDTALEDIESYAPAEQNKLIIAISDGKDLASRNFYPAFESHDQVRDYIAQRIATVQEGQNSFYNSQLNTYFIELPGGGAGTEEGANLSLNKLAELAGGTHFVASDKQGLKESLQTITDHVGGTYDLVYSSQQTPDDTDLELLIHAGNCSAKIKLPTQHQ